MRSLPFIILILSFSYGCKKDSVPLPTPSPVLLEITSDTSYVLQSVPAKEQRVVLAQEFTGVYCYTCPLAHEIIENFSELYPTRIAAMNIHSHFFGLYDNPVIMGNTYDFRTQDGDSLVSMQGGVVSVPSGSFDMVKFTGEDNIISQQRDIWSQYFNERLAAVTSVNIEVTPEFNSSSNVLTLEVTTVLTEDIPEDIFLSVALVENHIIDKQYVDTVVVDNYSHEHILKDCVTEYNGLQLNESNVPGRVYHRFFQMTIPQEWNEDNVELISYVHHRNSTLEVLQANKQEIK